MFEKQQLLDTFSGVPVAQASMNGFESVQCTLRKKGFQKEPILSCGVHRTFKGSSENRTKKGSLWNPFSFLSESVQFAEQYREIRMTNEFQAKDQTRIVLVIMPGPGPDFYDLCGYGFCNSGEIFPHKGGVEFTFSFV